MNDDAGRALREADVERQLAKLAQVRAGIARVIVGQEAVVEQLLIGLLAGGHCLLEGVPGLGKTLLVRTLGRRSTLDFRRIQFTPDLMPSDIAGTEILEEDHGTGRRYFRFRGPVFANLLLADEINRAPPKTQAALLEAMQEHTVSAAARPIRCREPFFVLATQNPIEQEGTYPLPEAQLDRFLLHVRIDYPAEAEERGDPRADDGQPRAAHRFRHARRRGARAAGADARGAPGRRRPRLDHAPRPRDAPAGHGRSWRCATGCAGARARARARRSCSRPRRARCCTAASP